MDMNTITLVAFPALCIRRERTVQCNALDYVFRPSLPKLGRGGPRNGRIGDDKRRGRELGQVISFSHQLLLRLLFFHRLGE